jgi:pyruvate,orthophosphate dikinase
MRTLAKGIGASPGRAQGTLVLDAARVLTRAANGEACVLVRVETNAEDGPGMRAARALVATRGGITADAAVVARALGKPCVVGCPTVHVDYAARAVRFVSAEGAEELREGDLIGVDGASGDLFAP